MKPRPAPVVTAQLTPGATAPVQPTIFHTIGLFALGIYIIAVYITDFSSRLLGGNPRAAKISGILVLLCFLLCGSMFRALGTAIARYWVFFAAWMVLAIPFSYWRGGSTDLVANYLVKSHVLFFAICAFATTVRSCRTLIYVNVAGGVALLASCAAFGEYSDGRLIIADSVQFNNPNDLAIQLVFTMGFFLYMILRKGWLGRLIGMAGMAGSVWYTLKTSSRGGFLALAVFFLVYIIFSHRRALAIALTVPAVLAVSLLSESTRGRLMLIVSDPKASLMTAGTELEKQSIGSQMQRTELLKWSLRLTATRPVFGVGPGEFGDYVRQASDYQLRAGQGTHNTYTQVASEIGVPALFAYVAVVFLSVRNSYRLYKRTRTIPEMNDVAIMTLALFVTVLSYAINLMFHHLAYTSPLPILAGLITGIQLAIEPLLAANGTSAPAGVKRAVAGVAAGRALSHPGLPATRA